MPERAAGAARVRVAFYADDMTGATDALAQYHRFGLRGLLLLERPPDTAASWPVGDVDVLGVAGVSRSLPPREMTREVRPVLEAFRDLEPEVVQYKICSTADSSPTTGSLGRAVEIGRDVFGEQAVPVLAAQPDLGRYTAFGNHFALERDTVYRLDRQPTMSRHPVTPMREADLRLHIGAQTSLTISSLDVTTYGMPPEAASARYRRLLAERPGAIVFDTLENAHLPVAARLMLETAERRPLFALGSGGLSYGLAAALSGGDPNGGLPPPPARHDSPLLVVSGSCSATTAGQIRWVLDRGWTGIALDVDRHGVDTSPAALARLRDRVLDGLATSPGAVVFTALGEPARGTSESESRLASIGGALGYIVDQAVRHAGVARVIVAGGDTSGRVMRAVNVAAVRIAGIISGGAVLCHAVSNDPAMDGTQVMLKGGQVGGVDLFETVRLGRRADGAPGTPAPR